MKNILVILLLIPIFGFSQKTVEEQVELQLVQSQNLLEQELGSSNFATIEQIGSGNDAEIIQQMSGSNGNFVLMSQQGSANIGYVNQSGASLSSQLVQINASNAANIWLIGENLSLTALQNGVRNSIDAYVESNGSNGIATTLLQEGNQNIINFAIQNTSGFNPGVGQSIGITQFGNNQNVTAQFENLEAPAINIIQNPGFGGAGMTVNVSTLPGFYYPNR